jgi:uncharacterized protein DUF3568
LKTNSDENFMKTKILFMALLASVLVLSGGCIAPVLILGGVAVGAGAVVYVNGELKDTEAVTYDNAYDATLAAMSDLKYTVVSQQKDVLTAQIMARSASDTKIQVTLNKQSGTVTEIRIRVGTFGDEALSKAILDKIKSHF